jgi:hypothetical protein
MSDCVLPSMGLVVNQVCRVLQSPFPRLSRLAIWKVLQEPAGAAESAFWKMEVIARKQATGWKVQEPRNLRW